MKTLHRRRMIPRPPSAQCHRMLVRSSSINFPPARPAYGSHLPDRGMCPTLFEKRAREKDRMVEVLQQRLTRKRPLSALLLASFFPMNFPPARPAQRSVTYLVRWCVCRCVKWTVKGISKRWSPTSTTTSVSTVFPQYW
jgi:hypothetical protein